MNSGDFSSPRKIRFCRLADEVLRYVVVHPEAQDTVEGIAEWWLLEQRVTCAIEEVQAALCDLVRKGFLVIVKHQDGRTHYHINREMEQRIHSHLNDAALQRQPEIKRKESRSSAGDG
jgi:hypothetical protein